MRGNLGVNVASLVGHCALRQYVMGEASLERAATPAEIHQMKEVLKASVRAGAAGFSTNQNPVHMYADGTPIQSRFATDEEIIELACALGEINQGAVQISRGSLGVSVPMRESVKLFEEISSRSGRPVIWQSITHRWDKPNEWRELLDLAGETIDRGVQSYPLCNARLFNNRLTMKTAQVFDDLPTWKTILFLPLEERIKAIKDPETRKKMRYEAVEETKSSRFSRRWDLVYLINAVKPENKHLEKKSVAEIAKIRNQDIIDAFLDLSLEEGLDTEFQTSSTNGDEKAVAEIIKSPYVLVGQSDAGAHLIYDAGFGYATRLLGLLGAREANHDGGRSRAQADLHGRVDLRPAGPRLVAPRHGGGLVSLRSGDRPRVRCRDGARLAGQRKALHPKSGRHRDDHRQRPSAGGKRKSHRARCRERCSAAATARRCRRRHKEI